MLYSRVTSRRTGRARMRLLGLVIFASLVGCDTGPSMEEKLALADQLMPETPELSEIYQRTCRNCHTLEATGAPLTGDQLHWKELIEAQGYDGLVENVLTGKGGMPPFGLCMECDPDQFAELIQFMAQQ